MAINFPTNPNNGDVHAGFTYNSTKGVWESVAPSMMPTSDTPPTSPSDGQMWFDTDGGGAFVYYEDADSAQWVEVIGSAGAAGADGAAGPAGADGSAAVYATVDDLPGTASAGDQAFVTASNRLYLWNGSGWYNIALINTTPSISGVSSSYALAIDGTPTIVTITATDPEGLPITYSIVSDTSGSIATVTSNNNVFTITPSTNTADAGSFSLTFRASDGVNIATAVSSFTLQFSVENSNYTTALITSVGTNNAVNNSFVDSSTNSHTITAAGNVTQTTFSPYRHGGYSTYFDGTGDYLLMSSSAAFAPGTGDFTLEAWIYPTAAWGTWNSIFSVNNNGAIFFGGLDSGFGLRASAVTNIVSSTDPVLNTWTHVAVTRSGTTVRLFYNGVLKDTQTSSQNFPAGNLYIGSSVSSETFTGYIADARIINGTAVYTSAFTPPTERLTAITNTSLLTCHLPYIADGSTNGHSITVNGNTKTEPFSPYDYNGYSASSYGGSMYFDGNDSLSLPQTSLDLGSDDFCVEAWAYTTSTSNQCIVGSYRYADGVGAWNLNINYNSKKIRFFIRHSGGSVIDGLFESGTFPTNQWVHVAVTRDGSNLRAFINGAQAGSTNTSIGSNTIDNAQTNYYVGVATDSQIYWQGYISDVRVVKGSSVYTSDFTPPTAPLTAITNTSLLLSGTNAGIIDKSQSSSQLILDGDTKCSSTQTKYRSTAIYTDGTGDRIRFQVENSKIATSWGVGGRPFTVEWWQYDEMPYTTNHIIGPNTGGGVGGWNSTNGHEWLTFFSSSTFYVQYFGTNGSYNTITGTASTMGFVQNQWQHIAHTYDGTTWRFYIDGTEALSSNLPNVPQAVNVSFATLGSMPDNAYHSATYYDDVRITKGLARYTANFTPPTAALEG